MRALPLLFVTACRIGFDPATNSVDGNGPTTPITITITGAGSGTIEVTAGGSKIPCATTCSVPAGTQVTFTAITNDGSWFRGWTNGCTTGRRPCELAVNNPLAVTADFTPEPNRIFMSSQPHDGALLPTAGDAFCTMLAQQAGLAGTFKPLLTTTQASWPGRFTGARGWIRVDGQPVADDLAAIDHRILAAITVDEKGNQVGAGSFWTPNAGNSGRCNDWTSGAANAMGTVIDAFRGSNYQSGGGAASCNTQARVLCAQADRSVPLDPVPDRGRIAFTSSVQWAAASGRPAADALCASDATAAGFAGSFKALLAMPGESPLARFDLDKPPWVRADGLPFLPTAAAWKTAAASNSSFHMKADRTSTFYGFVPTGTELDTPGTAASTCDGWTSATGSSGRVMFTWETDLRPTSSSNFCNSNVFILCLEE